MDHPIRLINVFTNTNWPLLRAQKQELVEVIAQKELDLATGDHDEISELAIKDTIEKLTGILHWIDAIQDAAELAGYPVVFDPTPDA